MKVNEWVAQATDKLKNAGIESAKLDAELLLCDNGDFRRLYREGDLPGSREKIITDSDKEIRDTLVERLSYYLGRRAMGEPLAYVVGHKEFYGRNFYVNRDVLIPRPETEQLIEMAIGLDPKKILDVGTGSGCIAITLDHELPEATVTATDVSARALNVAIRNAFRHSESITKSGAIRDLLRGISRDRDMRQLENFRGIDFVRSDLLENVSGKFDLIVANLPYIDANDPSWVTSKELEFEPKKALFATTRGMALIRKLIRETPKNLDRNGHLLLECDTRQINVVSKYAGQHGFQETERRQFALLLKYTS